MIRNLLRQIQTSKYAPILFKIYIVWCVIADLTLLGGIVWGFIYFW